jgi:mutual gliding-motility protein MglA
VLAARAGVQVVDAASQAAQLLGGGAPVFSRGTRQPAVGRLRLRLAADHRSGRFDPRLEALDLAEVVVGGFHGSGSAACTPDCPHHAQKKPVPQQRKLPWTFDVRVPSRYPYGLVPLVNHSHREIHLKLVYYGPGLGGKTTNLEYIHKKSLPQSRGKLISLMTESERTLFFDLLPVELGTFRGYHVRLHLCTVPGQIALDTTRKLVLRHVDGIVFVVDSQAGRLDDNIESIRNLEINLRLQGDDPDRMPLVVQYNKRDLPSAAPVAELREALRVPSGVAEVEAAALQGQGVFETLKRITKDTLALIHDPVRMRHGRSPSILPGRRASMFPGGRPPGTEGPTSIPAAAMVTIPKAPRLPRVDGE